MFAGSLKQTWNGMRSRKFATVFLAVAFLAGASLDAAEERLRRLNENVLDIHRKEQTAARATDWEHSRLGSKSFAAGVILQTLAFVLMFSNVVRSAALTARLSTAGRRPQSGVAGSNSASKWQMLASLSKTVADLCKNYKFLNLVMMLLAYAILDMFYAHTFVGERLKIYHVNTTCHPASLDCDASYGVIASSAAAALGDGCEKFNVHHPMCHELSFMRIQGANESQIKSCSRDPVVVGDLYFEGISKWALRGAFILGSFITLMLQCVDFLQSQGKQRIVKAAMAKASELLPNPRFRSWAQDAVRTGTSEDSGRENENNVQGAEPHDTCREIKSGAQDVVPQSHDAQGLSVESGDQLARSPSASGDSGRANEKVDARRAPEKPRRRHNPSIAILVRMAFDGLAYGLTMLVLEIQIDDDCIALRSMIALRFSVFWAYTVKFMTASTIFVFVVLFAGLILCKVGKCLKLFFSVLLVGLMIVSFATYTYSVSLAIYLAYNVPSDSGVIIGVILTVLTFAIQVNQLCNPSEAEQHNNDDGGRPVHGERAISQQRCGDSPQPCTLGSHSQSSPRDPAIKQVLTTQAAKAGEKALQTQHSEFDERTVDV